jgi:hypothetical protein
MRSAPQRFFKTLIEGCSLPFEMLMELRSVVARFAQAHIRMVVRCPFAVDLDQLVGSGGDFWSTPDPGHVRRTAHLTSWAISGPHTLEVGPDMVLS